MEGEIHAWKYKVGYKGLKVDHTEITASKGNIGERDYNDLFQKILEIEVHKQMVAIGSKDMDFKDLKTWKYFIPNFFVGASKFENFIFIGLNPE